MTLDRDRRLFVANEFPRISMAASSFSGGIAEHGERTSASASVLADPGHDIKVGAIFNPEVVSLAVVKSILRKGQHDR